MTTTKRCLPFFTLTESDKMFTIRYFTPYQQQWRTQSFSTLEEAKRMVEFYKSCGSPAELINN
jgi:cupin superfamily acireductone dioxygenase involved in methionine salvage